ncbi:MAG: hypothetical protein J2P57_14655 [Acidimicrobiaceae bacterium]|nr:hypothetical protein [Acidimicrobiaceae bacterium]
MKLGAILICDAARPRQDGLFDAVGAGQQVAVVDLRNRVLSRSLIVQLLAEPQDVGVERQVDIVLVTESSDVLAGMQVGVRAADRPDAPAGALSTLSTFYFLHVSPRIEAEGTYRVAVLCDGDLLGEWPFKVAFVELPPRAVPESSGEDQS